MTSTAVAPETTLAIKPRLSSDDYVMRAFILLVGVWMIIAVLLPLYFMMSKSVEDKDGNFIGMANFVEYFSTPALSYSIYNSLFIAALSTVITVTLAFIYAYALTRSAMRLKGLFKVIALFPLLAPSLLPAISFVYLFGKQGIINWVLGGYSIYGPIGIVMGYLELLKQKDTPASEKEEDIQRTEDEIERINTERDPHLSGCGSGRT